MEKEESQEKKATPQKSQTHPSSEERVVSLKLGLLEVLISGTRDDELEKIVKLANIEMKDLSKQFVDLTQKRGVTLLG